MNYSAFEMPLQYGTNPVTVRLRHYLDRLLDELAERVAPKVSEEIMPRVHEEYASLAATVDILSDPALMADIKRADQEDDQDAKPYEEIRRELGLA